jgi:hypothetical protein
MVTSLLEKLGETVAQLLDGKEPRGKHLVPLVGQRVGALRRARQLSAPLRGDESFLLERPQLPVEVPDVDPVLAGKLGQPFDELVAMRRPAREQEKERRLAEALHPSPH